jgi:hypothetical protein
MKYKHKEKHYAYNLNEYKIARNKIGIRMKRSKYIYKQNIAGNIKQTPQKVKKGFHYKSKSTNFK